MTLEENRDRKCKGERIPPNTFILTDAKRIKLNCLTKPEKVMEMDSIPALKKVL